MQKFFIYSFLVITSISLLGADLYAQNKRIDSLKNEWYQKNDQDSLITVGMELIDAYFREGNAVEGLQVGEKLISILHSKGSNSQLAWTYNRMGTLYNNIGGKETEALEASLLALDYAEKAGDKYMKGIVYNNLGNVFRELSFTSKALEFYIKSLEICDELGDWEGAGYAYKNIGITYEDQEWHEKALEYHLKSLQIREKVNNSRQIVSSSINVAISYTNLGLTDSAEYHLQKAFELNEVSPTRLGDEIYQERGRIYELKGAWEEAKNSYEEALKLSYEVGKLRTATQSLERLAMIYLREGNLLQAALWIDSLGVLARENQITQALIAYYESKYDLERQRGNEIESLRFFKLKSELSDSSEKKAAIEEIVQQRVILDLIEKEKQLLLQREKQKYERTIYLTVSFFLVLLVLTLLLLVLSKLKSNRQLRDKQKEIATINEEISQRNLNLEQEVEIRTKELFEHNQQLEQFAFMTAHNFRGPVARILGLGAILKMDLEKKEKKEIFQKLIDTTKELDQVIKDLNRILEVQSNQQKATEEIQFEHLLKKVLDVLKDEILISNTQIQYDFQAKTFYGVPAYVFSIFYNLISNSIKYVKQTESPKIHLSSKIIDEKLILEVLDEGMGIDINKHQENLFKIYKRFHEHNKGKGMGLFLVKTQVEAMGGSIRLASEIGKGCLFTMEFPLAVAKDEINIPYTSQLKPTSKHLLSDN